MYVHTYLDVVLPEDGAWESATLSIAGKSCETECILPFQNHTRFVDRLNKGVFMGAGTMFKLGSVGVGVGGEGQERVLTHFFPCNAIGLMLKLEGTAAKVVGEDKCPLPPHPASISSMGVLLVLVAFNRVLTPMVSKDGSTEGQSGNAPPPPERL